ncbi:UNVERIFIED_ORG: hypothetical protein M2438_000534 [Methylobacterium sp. SuP10 SLI 274]|nr:hypothetical protein [Methylorubrum extorquens]MDF9790032.1 hypothetical protein [Methylorubrum extorquens]MDF9861733.1 hypothetical protein [Methylorubrum pseudosasae]MDH6635359.1 hypothetical protein [Methylobacterium sp. SuP10 SLI 274]MDH6664531.1 hypothetical protein [Methylorubrum zatmanii]
MTEVAALECLASPPRWKLRRSIGIQIESAT